MYASFSTKYQRLTVRFVTFTHTGIGFTIYLIRQRILIVNIQIIILNKTNLSIILHVDRFIVIYVMLLIFPSHFNSYRCYGVILNMFFFYFY